MIVELTESEMKAAEQILAGLNLCASARQSGITEKSVKIARGKVFRAAGIDTRKWHGAVRLVWLVHIGQITLQKRRP